MADLPQPVTILISIDAEQAVASAEEAKRWIAEAWERAARRRRPH